GNGEPGPCTSREERSAIRPAAAGNPADDMRHDGTHLHARPFAAKRQPRADRQQPAEEFDRYQIGRRRRQLPIQRRLDMREPAPPRTAGSPPRGRWGPTRRPSPAAAPPANPPPPTSSRKPAPPPSWASAITRSRRRSASSSASLNAAQISPAAPPAISARRA